MLTVECLCHAMKRCEVEEETAGQEEKLVIEEERTETVEQPPDSTYDFIDMSLYASVIMLFPSTDACFLCLHDVMSLLGLYLISVNAVGWTPVRLRQPTVSLSRRPRNALRYLKSPYTREIVICLYCGTAAWTIQRANILPAALTLSERSKTALLSVWTSKVPGCLVHTGDYSRRKLRL